MIDGERDEFEIAPGESASVNAEPIERALSLDGPPNKLDNLIRHRFDSLLYNLERIERSLEVGLVEFSDITRPTAYDVARLRPYHEQSKSYARSRGFCPALKSLGRFPEWSVQLSNKVMRADAASPRRRSPGR